jgi:hypothetical protein
VVDRLEWGILGILVAASGFEREVASGVGPDEAVDVECAKAEQEIGHVASPAGPKFDGVGATKEPVASEVLDPRVVAEVRDHASLPSDQTCSQLLKSIRIFISNLAPKA